MSDFRVKLTVRNARMLRAMEARGMFTARALAERAGVHYMTVCKYLALRSAPIGRNGIETEAARKVAKALGRPLVDLFPPGFMCEALLVNSQEQDVDARDLAPLLERYATRESDLPALAHERDDARKALYGRMRDKLNPREARVLAMRFGFEGDEMTFGEIGQHFNLSVERVRQIEAKALRKMKGPTVRQFRHSVGALLQEDV